MTIRAIYIYSQSSKAHAPVNTRTFPDGSAFVNADVSEPLEILVRNDCHLVSRIDHPKPVEPPTLFPAFPRTLQEASSPHSATGILRLERAVGQLLASGNVKTSVCQTLLQRLEQLAQEYERLRQGLAGILNDDIRRADERAAERK